MKVTSLRARLERVFRYRRPASCGRLAAAVVTGGMLFSGSAAEGADIVVNGGFEIPAGQAGSGWTNQGDNYNHPYSGINGPQLTLVGTLNDYGFNDNLSASAGTAFHGLSFPTTQTVDLVNADLTAVDIAMGEGRFAFSAWLAACCNDSPKITATFDSGSSVTFNRGISDHLMTTADILVNPGGPNNAESEGVQNDVNRRYWALYEFKGAIPTGATEVTITIDDGRADAVAAGSTVTGFNNGNDNYADMVIFDAVKSTAVIPDSVLRLSVDRDTGDISIFNNTAAPQAVKGYSIRSAAGALLESEATFLADGDANWIQFTAPGATGDLSEGHLESETFAVGPIHDLGSAWLQYYDEAELTFDYIDGEGTFVRGLVEFTAANQQTPFARGDLNFDGSIDGDDWLEFADGLGKDLTGLSSAAAYREGDLNGDMETDHADFLEFQDLFPGGRAALEAVILATAIPEPSALALLVFAGAGIAGLRVRTR